jgi:hypothetical protein
MQELVILKHFNMQHSVVLMSLLLSSKSVGSCLLVVGSNGTQTRLLEGSIVCQLVEGFLETILKLFFGNIGVATFLHAEISDAIFFIEFAHPKG